MNDFFSDIEQLQFSDARSAANEINSWVEKQTHGKVNRLVSEGWYNNTNIIIHLLQLSSHTWMCVLLKFDTCTLGSIVFYWSSPLITPFHVISFTRLTTKCTLAWVWWHGESPHPVDHGSNSIKVSGTYSLFLVSDLSRDSPMLLCWLGDILS